MSSFNDSERANPNTGLRSSSGTDSDPSAPVPSYLDAHVVDAFSRMPGGDDTVADARANPSLGLRTSAGPGATYFNTGIKSSHSGTLSGLPGMKAIPGKPFVGQPPDFKQAVDSLPAGVQQAVVDILQTPGCDISIEVDVAACTARVHSSCNGRQSTMHASWDAKPKDIPAPSSSAGLTSCAATQSTSKASMPPSQTGGTIFDSLPGIVLARQDKLFQDAVASAPQAIQDRIINLLADQKNHVFLDINIDEGKSAIICKNGVKTSVTNASWIPGFAADHQYVPAAAPVQHKSVTSSTSEYASATAVGGVIPTQAAVIVSTLGGVVHTCIPGVPVDTQSPQTQQAICALPKAVQDKVTDLLAIFDNHVYIDLNCADGKASIICKNRLKTSTLNASWNPLAHPAALTRAPESYSAINGVVGPVHETPRFIVREDQGVNPGERANPSTGLRKLF